MKQHRYRFFISIIATLLIVRIYLTFFKSSSPQICCHSTCFTLELAQTDQEKQRWLMFRETLPENAGMLFIFETEQTHSFRMKNTLIPLDMLRLDTNLQIVDIQAAAPCKTDSCPSYIPAASAKYVLELNQEASKKSWIEIWDTCSLSLPSKNRTIF